MRTYTFKTPFLLKKLYPGLVWDMKEPGKKSLYLTFDDGPIPEVTPWLLELLRKEDIRATFFMVGDNVRKYPEIFSAVKEGGHAIGNHTFNHLNGWNTGLENYVSNVEKCTEILRANGVERNLFRPPYGKITRKQISQLKDQHQIIMWDYLTGDFDQSLSSEKIIKKFKKGVQPGSVVVFHDNVKSFGKLQATLPSFLNFFKQKGYHFETL